MSNCYNIQCHWPHTTCARVVFIWLASYADTTLYFFSYLKKLHIHNVYTIFKVSFSSEQKHSFGENDVYYKMAI